eukprot:1335751-Amorphochlora_amoeboformis.AAC.1
MRNRLCAAGANIDLQDKNQRYRHSYPDANLTLTTTFQFRTPLHLACLKGDVSAAKASYPNLHSSQQNPCCSPVLTLPYSRL